MAAIATESLTATRWSLDTRTLKLNVFSVGATPWTQGQGKHANPNKRYKQTKKHQNGRHLGVCAYWNVNAGTHAGTERHMPEHRTVMAETHVPPVDCEKSTDENEIIGLVEMVMDEDVIASKQGAPDNRVHDQV